MDIANNLQYIGVITGLSGAILVSQRSPSLRRHGFLLWLVSNSCLIWWAWSTGTWGLLANGLSHKFTMPIAPRDVSFRG